MTCHLVIQGASGIAVMFSDSQGSSPISETHGVEKQFMGKDFLVGGAGRIDIINAMFEALYQGYSAVDSSNIEQFMLDFVEGQLTHSAKTTVGFLIATPSSLFELEPGTYRRFRKRKGFATIGSGSEFVIRAIVRDCQTGLYGSLSSSVSQILCEVENYIAPSNESLTVDDQFLVGILSNSKTYLIGDKRNSPNFAPAKILTEWSYIAEQYDEILALVRTVRAEVSEIHRALLPVKYGLLDDQAYARIVSGNDSVMTNQTQLEEKLKNLLEWYDDLLGR